MDFKDGQFDVVCINLNAQNVNGKTPFDLTEHVQLLDNLKYNFVR